MGAGASAEAISTHALRQFDDALAATNQQTLAIVHCDLLVIPPTAIAKALHLRELRLNHTRLSALPTSFGCLVHLVDTVPYHHSALYSSPSRNPRSVLTQQLTPTMADALRIPEVDLAAPNAAQQLRAACMDVGFFYLVNHGVESTLLQQVYAEMAFFFKQPREEKEKVLANKYMRGYTMMNEETLDPAVQTRGDTKEGYYICRHTDESSPDMQFPLHGPNLFPDAEKYPRFQPVMETYHRVMSDVGLTVAKVFASAAGAHGAFDADGLFDKPMAALRLLRYDAVPSDVSSGVFGAGAHTDYGLITLLSTDENPGLQIWYKDQQWVDVPPRPDAFIVNIGDMGERWTNGLFKSTRHRVVNLTGKERYSVPFFYEPNYTCRVECFPSCVSDENPAKYEPTTSGEHLVAMYKATHAGFDA